MLRKYTTAAMAAAIAFVPAAGFAQVINCNTQCPGLQGASALEPRYGGSNSMQFQNAAVALDLNEFEPDGTEPSGDADTIGGAATYGKAGFQKYERFDLHYQHARRIKEGSRARLLIDVPLSVSHANEFSVSFFGGSPFKFGGTAVYGTLNVGLELPVNPNFLITPRIAYSNLQAGQYFGYDAELVTGSVTTRYKLPQVGRGDLTFGGMAAYSHTIDTFLAKQPGYTSADYWTLRGGLAYQLPLKHRMFGRQSSIRASYVFTYETGQPFMMYKKVHELGLNIGVRTREAEQKNRFEQLRVGVLYTHATNEFTSQAHSDAGTLTLGYRF
jgi:opacity protein-like surface antigen